MRKAWMLLFLSVVLIVASGNSQAANKIGTMGAPDSSGTYAVEVFDDRSVVFPVGTGLLMSYESATTNDTLTVNDCGKTIMVAPTTNATFTLPPASTVPGCVTKLVATTGASTKKIILDVASTDKLRGVINSAAPDTFAIGDSTISPGNTNDTIAVISGGGTIWDVVDIRGTWTDNN